MPSSTRLGILAPSEEKAAWEDFLSALWRPSRGSYLGTSNALVGKTHGFSLYSLFPLQGLARKPHGKRHGGRRESSACSCAAPGMAPRSEFPAPTLLKGEWELQAGSSLSSLML